MSASAAPAVGFWRTVWLLLGVARKRAAGRRHRIAKMRKWRVGSRSPALSALGFAVGVLFFGIANLGAAFDLVGAFRAGEIAQAEAEGKLIVGEDFAKVVPEMERKARRDANYRKLAAPYEEADVRGEASRIVKERGGDFETTAAKLRAALRAEPWDIMISAEAYDAGPATGRLPDMLALIVLLMWSAMLVCQGEGPDLDARRPRHPMWEFLFSHPAPPSAIFLAEMLAPIAANPVYITAPLFPGLIYGCAYDWQSGIAAAFLVGIPLAVALACVGRALEIRILLRFSPRVRGAILGLMGWYGYASLLAFLILLASFQKLAAPLAALVAPLAALPWPPVRALAGHGLDGSHAFWRGVAICDAISLGLIAAAVVFATASARRGLAGNFSLAAPAPRANADRRSRFGREPLYRKEWLWFRRDGSALVQVVLVPLSLAAMQLVNLRGVIANAGGAWNYICGVGILFGTYFLLILGPKSLASEGPALWIALTWPRGLESLLKAKARLWASIAFAIVAVVLAYAAWRYPADIGRIALVAIGWFFFSRSLADKTVTLATVASPSGEPEKIPLGQRWAASIGLLTFAIGVLTRQWSVAIAGVVYSQLTAAALWQNFRWRLPYLYDSWSETLPPAPTLMHAMIAISAMVEGASILSASAIPFVGRDNLMVVTPIAYGLCAIVACFFVARFLRRRGVPQREIWTWPRDGAARGLPGVRGLLALIALGVALGLALGLVARGYTMLLHWLPLTRDIVLEAEARMKAIPHARVSFAIMAVLFAPLAEEFLFRGLLFRALDREWGGWRAILGAAAFFAIYHPLLSWPAVAALGAVNATLFKRTGQLAPAVALHMAYNATVLP